MSEEMPNEVHVPESTPPDEQPSFELHNPIKALKLKLAIYKAAAKELNTQFEDDQALEKFFDNPTDNELKGVDSKQVTAIMKAVCAIVGPICDVVNALP